MDKREACHRLADINEKISELEDLLEDVESRLRWDDESRRDWYNGRKEELAADLARFRQAHDELISDYGDIIYS